MKKQKTKIFLATLLLASFAQAGNSYTLSCNGGGNEISMNHYGEHNLYVKFKASSKGSKYARPRVGECTWKDRSFRRNEPRKFCHFNIRDFRFTRNSGGYALASEKASYIDKLRIGGFFSLKVHNNNRGCMVVDRVL